MSLSCFAAVFGESGLALDSEIPVPIHSISIWFEL